MLNDNLPRSLHGEKEVNDWMKEKIKDLLEIKTGEHMKSIEQGKLKEGAEIICKNAFLQMIFELDSVGRLVFQKDKSDITDLKLLWNTYPDADKIFKEWCKSSPIFLDRRQIVLTLTGRERLTGLDETFPFTPEPVNSK